MEHKKMKNTAENLDKLAKIAAGFMRAFVIVCLIFAVLVLVLGEKMFDVDTLSLDLDFVKLYLAAEYRTVTTMLQTYAVVGLVAVAAMCAAISIALGHLRRILAPMKEGRPFAEDTAVNLRKIAWNVLIIGGITQLVSVVERMILTKAYPMDAIFASDAVVGIEYAYTMDFSFVLVFAVIMLLSYIFAYGQKLQQESDETL